MSELKSCPFCGTQPPADGGEGKISVESFIEMNYAACNREEEEMVIALIKKWDRIRSPAPSAQSVQTIELPDEQQIELYLKMEKEELAKMLVNANKTIRSMGGFVLMPSSPDVGEVLEELAELEHRQWMLWSNEVVDHFMGSPLDDATEVCNRVFSKQRQWIEHWKPYKELSESAKEKDREWAQKVLAIIARHYSSPDALAFIDELEKEMRDAGDPELADKGISRRYILQRISDFKNKSKEK